MTKRAAPWVAVALLLALAGPSPAAASSADEVALVEPNGCWHARVPGPADFTFLYGNPGDVPLLGDWDGDGIDTPGAYRPANGFAYLTNETPAAGRVGVGDPALTFFFGAGGDQVIVGDWDGDGADTLGVMRDRKIFVSNVNATVAADVEFFFGAAGDVPFGGDPDGDGRDGVFLYRPSTGFVYFTDDVRAGGAAPTDGEFFFGIPDDRPVIGDWDGDGADSAGVFRPRERTAYLRNALATGPADRIVRWGGLGWSPVAGVVATEPDPEATCASPLAPLTGLAEGDASRRVVVAKYSNSRRARPQAGINQADMVMETIVEGGISRWLAVYQSDYPPTVGPLRSVREVDPKLIAPFDARVVHSGGPAPVRESLAKVAVDDGAWLTPGYRRDPARPWLYDVMYDLAALPPMEWDGPVERVLDFDVAPPPGGQTAVQIEIAMSPVSVNDWEYLGGRYQRLQGGRPATDAASVPITADSVVVAFVESSDTGRVDSAGTPVPDYKVVGTGPAVVFRDGRAYPGSWKRASKFEFFRFFDGTGRPLTMLPGRTWIHVTPTSGSASWS